MNLRAVAILVALVALLSACSTSPAAESTAAPPPQTSSPSVSPAPPPPRPKTSAPPPVVPELIPDPDAPVDADLERLAREFTAYAVGASDDFPHWESVAMGLGGQVAVYIDDIVATLSQRKIWRICPADWKWYAAGGCPIDLLGPLHAVGASGHELVFSGRYDEVTCAPDRVGPHPEGRIVVLRPPQRWRTCASDFALVLAADADGLLRAVDLTLSEP